MSDLTVGQLVAFAGWKVTLLAFLGVFTAMRWFYAVTGWLWDLLTPRKRKPIERWDIEDVMREAGL